VEAHVITFTLCKQHGTYYAVACPRCFLERYEQQERQTGEAVVVPLADVAYLAATSSPMPMVP
jgi:hypothetical protein